MATRLPDPPLPLTPLRPGDVFELPAGARVARIYAAGGDHPSTWRSFRTFGPVPTMRFDHHLRPERPGERRAVSYCAPAAVRRATGNDPLETCLAEVFSSTAVIDLSQGQPWFTIWVAARPLRLLDVVDCRWITRARGNAAISSGEHAQSQKWAKAIHHAYQDVDGIYYETSSIPMRRSVALFERAETALPAAPEVNVPLNHAGLRAAVKRVANDLGFRLHV